MIRILTYLILLFSCTTLLAQQSHTRMVGNKSYELSNHLGNVLEVTTDRKTDKNTEAEIVAYNDYYPYGMLMGVRSGRMITYSYGFNGMEDNKQILGDGNNYTTFFRQNDVRLAKWISMDPKGSKKPWQTPYSSMDENPIINTDTKGDFIPIVVAGITFSAAEVGIITAGALTAGYMLANREKIAERISDIQINYHSFYEPIDPKSLSTSRGTPREFPPPFRGKNSSGNPNSGGNGGTKWIKTIVAGGLLFAATDRLFDHVGGNEGAAKSIKKKLEDKGATLSVETISKDVNIKDKIKFKVIKTSIKVNYEIQKDDNLTEIAEKFNTTVDKLVENNNIGNKNLIYEGDNLIVGEETVETIEKL